jgi:hypothetical protein
MRAFYSAMAAPIGKSDGFSTGFLLLQTFDAR